MATIQVEIDCDGEYCGDCKYQRMTAYNDCEIFETELKRDNNFKVKRCPQCLQSEVKND